MGARSSQVCSDAANPWSSKTARAPFPATRQCGCSPGDDAGTGAVRLSGAGEGNHFPNSQATRLAAMNRKILTVLSNMFVPPLKGRGYNLSMAGRNYLQEFLFTIVA
jgi:hypothetical protein